MQRATEYPNQRYEEKGLAKTKNQRSYERPLDIIKTRHEAQKQQHSGGYRKHNSPDYNKYRTQDIKNNPRIRGNHSPEEQQNRRAKDEEHHNHRKMKELPKNNSTPSLDLKQLAQ